MSRASSLCEVLLSLRVSGYHSQFILFSNLVLVALEWAPHKITVNCFAGGCINTAMRMFNALCFPHFMIDKL